MGTFPQIQGVGGLAFREQEAVGTLREAEVSSAHGGQVSDANSGTCEGPWGLVVGHIQVQSKPITFLP